MEKENQEIQNFDIFVPEKFDDIENSNMIIQLKLQNDKMSPPSSITDKNNGRKNGKIKKSKLKKNDNKKGFQHDWQFQEESKKYLFGLNGYRWVSNFRNFFEIFGYLGIFIIWIIFVIEADRALFRYICMIFAVMEVLKLIDYIFCFFKKSLFFGDFFTSLASIIFWGCSIYSGFEELEFLYIAACGKLFVDLLLYSSAFICSRKNPVRKKKFLIFLTFLVARLQLYCTLV